MRQIAKKESLKWCKSRSVGSDSRYGEPRCLVYMPYRLFHRFREVPEDSDQCREIAERVVQGPALWSRCTAWKRGRYWVSGHETREHLESLVAAGVPEATECAL